MTIHDEFLEILRVLVETPQSAGNKPPSSEKEQTPEAAPDKVGPDKEHADGSGRRAVS
jgi:hypothetical protein